MFAQVTQQHIRNFCIIAHINHGKSTLADRLLELTNTVEKRKMREQTLDSMELEREKGITIKLKAVRMNYDAVDGNNYQLNLIDTPGHVDFSYEVSRSLAACEGAILIVDAAQGIEAQTVSNIYKALEANLTIIPVLNKIDLENANADEVATELERAFGFTQSEILRLSAKTGENVDRLLAEIVRRIPPPAGSAQKPLRALVFDTYYDEHLGVVAHTKIVDGLITAEDIKKREKIRLMATAALAYPENIGIMNPQKTQVERLSAGEVGYIATGLKDIKSVRVGDTITFQKYFNKGAEIKGIVKKANTQKKDTDSMTMENDSSATRVQETAVVPLPGYKEIKPFVFVSIFPIQNNKFTELREALQKLALSDSALSFEPESNSALGFGFRCGFLGLLHADIVQERLEREYNLELLSTIPTVEYKIYLTDGTVASIKNAADLPSPTKIQKIEEPWILLSIISPVKYVGGIITLCEKRRGVQKKMEYPTPHTIIFAYELPLAELIHNFFDELKTVSSGYASLDYDFLDYRDVAVVKLDILVHGAIVDPLAQIVLKNSAHEKGKATIAKLKDTIPRQQFAVALQAAIGSKIIARDTIPAMRKNVLAGIYGGHRERKDKLLEVQKKGKKRMKRFGKVDIPQEAFREVLKT